MRLVAISDKVVVIGAQIIVRRRDNDRVGSAHDSGGILSQDNSETLRQMPVDVARRSSVVRPRDNEVRGRRLTSGESRDQHCR